MTDNKKRLVKFVGKCLYPQVYPGQERPPHEEAVKKDPHTSEDRHYVITMECSEDLYKKLISAGISRMTALKEIDGRTYITIKATKKKRIDKESSEFYTFNDPIVTDSNDEPLDINTLIGNGSDVEVYAELADLNHFKALRLQSVKVLNLVPYIKKVVEGEVEFEETVKQNKVNKDDDNLF